MRCNIILPKLAVGLKISSYKTVITAHKVDFSLGISQVADKLTNLHYFYPVESIYMNM